MKACFAEFSKVATGYMVRNCFKLPQEPQEYGALVTEVLDAVINAYLG